MNTRIAVLLAASLFATNVAGQVNALPSLPHLLVKGEASRDVVPDRFTVSVTLSALDMSPDAAREKVQSNLAQLIAALKDSGALAETIDATVFSIAPEYVYEDERRVFKGTKVTRQLRVTFADADRTRAFLSSLRASEDVQVAGITPFFSGEASLRADLKTEAMKQTRETAELLAKSYGTRIRGLYSVSDVAPSFAYGIQAGRWTRARSGLPAPPGEPPIVFDAPSAVDRVTVTGSRITPESIEVGTITISEHLYAVFLLAD